MVRIHYNLCFISSVYLNLMQICALLVGDLHSQVLFRLLSPGKHSYLIIEFHRAKRFIFFLDGYCMRLDHIMWPSLNAKYGASLLYICFRLSLLLIPLILSRIFHLWSTHGMISSQRVRPSLLFLLRRSPCFWVIIYMYNMNFGCTEG